MVFSEDVDAGAETSTSANIRKDIQVYVTVMQTTTAELQWLEHLWNDENKFETGVFRANEC